MAWLESVLQDSKKAGRLLSLIIVLSGAGIMCYTDNVHAEKWMTLTAAVVGFYFSNAGQKTDNQK